MTMNTSLNDLLQGRQLDLSSGHTPSNSIIFSGLDQKNIDNNNDLIIQIFFFVVVKNILNENVFIFTKPNDYNHNEANFNVTFWWKIR